MAANQESTAINDLIQLVQGGRRPDRESENPVPELFVPAVRLQETLDEASGDIPSLGRHRAPAGTPAPYVIPSVAAPYPLPTPIAHGTPAQAYRVPTHNVEVDEEQTELWQGTPQNVAAPVPTIAPPMYARAISSYVPPAHLHALPATPRYQTQHLPRELSPMIRYAGLGLLALLAISIGTYLGAAGGGSDEPNERDRAIAIMSGEMPAPVATTHVTAPTMPTVRIEAAPPPAAIVEPAKEPVIAAPVVIESTEIEMEAETRKPGRRAARAAKPQAKVAKPVQEDQIQKLLAEKPKAAKKTEKVEKAKPKKDLVATEITVPKGAAVVAGNGQVTISSNRRAMIYLDGRPTGKTAPSALVIPAGDHQITLLDPDTKKAKTATVKIAANKSVSISRDFN